VQLITNQFSAEFGGHSAGVASMITKSGTNEVKGSAFVMITPGDWDAAPPLAPIVNGEKVKAPYNQQQFGGTAGGPIAHDKPAAEIVQCGEPFCTCRSEGSPTGRQRAGCCADEARPGHGRGA